jgi:hypothetical protein
MRAPAIIRSPGAVGLQEVITESDLFTPEELDRDAFQREFLDRFGLRWFSSFGAIHFDQISPVVLTLERATKHERFSRSEVEQISAIAPHIQRASRLSLAVAAAAAAGIMAGLDHVNRAAILLDDLGLVVRMNGAAEHLMGHGLTVSNRRLRASTRDGDRLLQKLIAIAAANKPPHQSPALDAVAIPRRNGRPLVVQGAPLVNSARDLFQQARAILIIRDLDRRMEPDDFLLRELFALTPAEIKLAKAIAGGQKLSEVAHLLGVSSATACAPQVDFRQIGHAQSVRAVRIVGSHGRPARRSLTSFLGDVRRDGTGRIFLPRLTQLGGDWRRSFC